ncbi:MAG TPA: hypothetical protein VGI58_16500 [Streptosporangiaceae bacterium]|jgi:hypothetical protein
MNVWYVEVTRTRDDSSEEVSRVGYLHEPTPADLAELAAEGWEVGQIGQQSLSANSLGSPGSDPVIIRTYAAVVANFLKTDMDAFLNEGKPPPTSALQEAKAISAAADEAGLTELAVGLQRVIDEAEHQIAERRRRAG